MILVNFLSAKLPNFESTQKEHYFFAQLSIAQMLKIQIEIVLQVFQENCFFFGFSSFLFLSS